MDYGNQAARTVAASKEDSLPGRLNNIREQLGQSETLLRQIHEEIFGPSSTGSVKQAEQPGGLNGQIMDILSTAGRIREAVERLMSYVS